MWLSTRRLLCSFFHLSLSWVSRFHSTYVLQFMCIMISFVYFFCVFRSSSTLHVPSNKPLSKVLTSSSCLKIYPAHQHLFFAATNKGFWTLSFRLYPPVLSLASCDSTTSLMRQFVLSQVSPTSNFHFRTKHSTQKFQQTCWCGRGQIFPLVESLAISVWHILLYCTIWICEMILIELHLR